MPTRASRFMRQKAHFTSQLSFVLEKKTHFQSHLQVMTILNVDLKAPRFVQKWIAQTKLSMLNTCMYGSDGHFGERFTH